MRKRLRTKQLKAILLLANGVDTQEILERLKIRWSTLSQWRKMPEFMARLEVYKREVMEDIYHSNDWWTGKLAHYLTRGIEREFFSEFSPCNLKKVETLLNVLKHAAKSSKSAETGRNASKFVKTGQDASKDGEISPLPPVPDGVSTQNQPADI